MKKKTENLCHVCNFLYFFTDSAVNSFLGPKLAEKYLRQISECSNIFSECFWDLNIFLVISFDPVMALSKIQKEEGRV